MIKIITFLVLKKVYIIFFQSFISFLNTEEYM